jgi:hypothetical protein
VSNAKARRNRQNCAQNLKRPLETHQVCISIYPGKPILVTREKLPSFIFK